MSEKTNKAVAKRFKKTASGKLLRRKPGYNHMLSAKSTKQRRESRQDQSIGKGFNKKLGNLILD